MKKGQFESWLVNVLFYLALIIVVAIIVWSLVSGRATGILEGIFDKLRFA